MFARGRLNPRKIATGSGRLEVLAALEAAVGNKGELDASPAARATVTEELLRARRTAENAAALRTTLRHTRTLERKLYPYQTEGLTRFLESGRLLLADDIGLGKTTQAIAACHVLFESERVR
ncbi:MAG TPA: hypothetical protein VI072_13810 [Polyangiaceae bacterium]